MRISAVVLSLLVSAAPAAAQSDQDHSHQGEAPQQHGTTSESPQTGSMMDQMPEQCRAAMQAMPQTCMGMMQQMMPGMGSMQSGQAMPSGGGSATAAYMGAMDKMHGPMAAAAKDPDPEIAFVKGMIPHHEGAIEMARIVLQHAKDEQVKKWANDVIAAQEREIAEMQAWLKAKGN